MLRVRGKPPRGRVKQQSRELARSPGHSTSQWDAEYDSLTGDVDIVLPSSTKMFDKVIVSITPAELERLLVNVRKAMAVPAACPRAR